ncbi:MAG: biotin-dependent carboxyltransferase family protein [Pseudodonghicola sp.]|nr:biotin-dependent carboxyltransferase family protein [Pseudodonghicola sp.]
MTLEILSAGPLVSVQDRGRRGLRRFGVSAAGPMDAPAHALANALCGNPQDTAVLEFAGLGGQFRSDRPLRFAVTGGDCDISVDGTPLSPDESHRLEAGQVLKIGMLRDAVWGYLAVSGGIDTPLVMGARSTHLRFGLGGLCGRTLKAGDRLPLGEESGADVVLRPATPLLRPRFADPIRILLGPQDGHFAPHVLERLTREDFTITAQRDRMASILDGPDMPAERGHDIVSDGTVPGAIQVPGSGRPMVLMAECQTTGGYPKIATVISADLSRLAQMPTGTRLRFTVVERAAAEAAARAQAADLAAVLKGLVAKQAVTLTSEFLLSCDLVGGIHDPESIAPEIAQRGET